MKQDTTGVTLVYEGTAGGRLSGLVLEEKNKTQQRSNLALLRVVLSPLGSLSFASFDGLCSDADRFGTLTESYSGSWSLSSL